MDCFQFFDIIITIITTSFVCSRAIVAGYQYIEYREKYIDMTMQTAIVVNNVPNQYDLLDCEECIKKIINYTRKNIISFRSDEYLKKKIRQNIIKYLMDKKNIRLMT